MLSTSLMSQILKILTCFGADHAISVNVVADRHIFSSQEERDEVKYPPLKMRVLKPINAKRDN